MRARARENINREVSPGDDLRVYRVYIYIPGARRAAEEFLRARLSVKYERRGIKYYSRRVSFDAREKTAASFSVDLEI